MGISAIGQDFSSNMNSINNTDNNKFKNEENLFGAPVEAGGSVASSGLSIIA